MRIMLSGPSGIGKTTFMDIISRDFDIEKYSGSIFAEWFLAWGFLELCSVGTSSWILYGGFTGLAADIS